jgi:hypothetical protein
MDSSTSPYNRGAVHANSRSLVGPLIQQCALRIACLASVPFFTLRAASRCIVVTLALSRTQKMLPPTLNTWKVDIFNLRLMAGGSASRKIKYEM